MQARRSLKYNHMQLDNRAQTLLKALVDRLAEACAEWLHQQVRKEYWGYAKDEQLDFAEQGKELSTEQWIKVFREAREMGAAQLGFSGGEPGLRLAMQLLVLASQPLSLCTPMLK